MERSTRRRRAWFWFGVTAVVVLIGFEASARAIGPNTNQIPVIVERHRENLTTVEAEVLFVGDSSVGAAIEPTAFFGETDVTSYNLWLATASMQGIEEAVFDFGLELTDPSTVVIGVTGRMFNGSQSNQQLRRHDELVQTLPWQRVVDPSRYTSLETAIAERSAIVRYRAGLRRPSDWIRAVTLEQLFELDDLGHLSFPDHYTVEVPRPDHVEGEREALADYTPGSDELDALARTVVELDKRGIEVYVVDLPVYGPVYDTYYPDGAADVADYRASLAARLDGLPVELIDLSSFTTDPADFSDENHLTVDAARRLSTELADRILKEN